MVQVEIMFGGGLIIVWRPYDRRDFCMVRLGKVHRVVLLSVGNAHVVDNLQSGEKWVCYRGQKRSTFLSHDQ